MSTEIYSPIRHLQNTEPLPYTLLLLADEETQAIEQYIHQSDVYVIELSKKIIGVYVLYPVDEHTAELKAIAVDEDHQNKGLGKLMLQDAGERALQQGFTELIIGTPTIAAKQVSLYQKAGFEIYDIKKDFFIKHYKEPIYENGMQLTDMVMLKRILK